MNNDRYKPLPRPAPKEPKPFGLVDLFMFAALLPIGIACAILLNDDHGPSNEGP